METAETFKYFLKIGMINPKKRKMLKKEYQIIEPFIDKPWARLTFSQVKECSKKKSDSYIHSRLKQFVSEKILLEERAGNVILYKLNLSGLKCQAYSGMIAEHIAWSSKLPDLSAIYSKIPSAFFTFIITGSYAKNTQKAGSDIDIVILCDNPKKVYSELRYACEINIPQVHLYAFNEAEFRQMLLDDKQNYGKEIARNCRIVFGAENYFRILGEAVKNGFIG